MTTGSARALITSTRCHVARMRAHVCSVRGSTGVCMRTNNSPGCASSTSNRMLPPWLCPYAVSREKSRVWSQVARSMLACTRSIVEYAPDHRK